MIPPILIFLLVLSIVILVHELGHFLAARWAGIRADEFGWGLPPRAWGIYKSVSGKWKQVWGNKAVSDAASTIYSINWLPIEGFVKMFGEQEAEALGETSSETFFGKKKRQRAVVILAGVFMNVLLGLVIFSAVFSIIGIPETEGTLVGVTQVVPNSPASSAGILPGDRIVEVDGIKFDDSSKFVDYIGTKKGEHVVFGIERRSGQIDTYEVFVRDNPPEGEGSLGVAVGTFAREVYRFYPWWQMPFRGIWVGLEATFGWTLMIFLGLIDMVVKAFSGVLPEVAGPVGIFQLTAQVARQGIVDLAIFVGVLSINLAVLNLLPFPALDGGRFVFILLEGILGRRIKPQIEAWVNMAGMVVLLGLMIVVTFADLRRIFISGVNWETLLPDFLRALFVG